MDTRVVTGRPTRIRFRVEGVPDTPTVVCVHGVTLDAHAFDDQVPALRAAGFRVVTVDLAGHGASRPAAGGLSIAGAADDLVAVLDALDASRVVLVGQSFGGFVVQEVYRRQPWRVTALVLVGAWLAGSRPPWHQRLTARLRPGLLRLWPRRHLFAVTPRFMSRDPRVQRMVGRALRPLTKADLISFTDAAVAGLIGDGRHLEIDVPTLFAYGDGERAWVVRLTRGALDRLPKATFVSIPDAGHLANQDQPARFNEAMLTFLRAHAPPPLAGDPHRPPVRTRDEDRPGRVS